MIVRGVTDFPGSAFADRQSSRPRVPGTDVKRLRPPPSTLNVTASCGHPGSVPGHAPRSALPGGAYRLARYPPHRAVAQRPARDGDQHEHHSRDPCASRSPAPAVLQHQAHEISGGFTAKPRKPRKPSSTTPGIPMVTATMTQTARCRMASDAGRWRFDEDGRPRHTDARQVRLAAHFAAHRCPAEAASSPRYRDEDVDGGSNRHQGQSEVERHGRRERSRRCTPTSKPATRDGLEVIPMLVPMIVASVTTTSAIAWRDARTDDGTESIRN